MKQKKSGVIAYLSLEVALENNIKNYAGGLGVLAGDLLKSAADINFPLVGLSLISHRGYFRQTIGPDGEQKNKVESNYDFSKLVEVNGRVTINIGEDQVIIKAWCYEIKGPKDFIVPVYFLDTDLEENKAEYRDLSASLYLGDRKRRLFQEIVLGRGGLRLLKALGYQIKKIHLNEGHGALAAIELYLNSTGKTLTEKRQFVRDRLVFTTHTPITAAQDFFSVAELKIVQPDFPEIGSEVEEDNKISFTKVCLYFSGYCNGVSARHGQVSRQMYPNYKIDYITNGVHSVTWTAPEFAALYDKYLPGWRLKNIFLKKAKIIPASELWQAHLKTKKRLFKEINKQAGIDLKMDIFTIGFARRFTAYKRSDFLLANLKKLAQVATKFGGLQIIYAGKAHPSDLVGQSIIKKIVRVSQKPINNVKIVFWEDYDLNKAKLLVAGVDLWLNTPLPPNEASGTSGMKAAHNGIPQLSTPDGWWPEAVFEGKNGWTIKELAGSQNNLYDLLEKEILPIYFDHLQKWQAVMRASIFLSAGHFNTNRVLKEYINMAY